jgi:hypothetical protein
MTDDFFARGVSMRLSDTTRPWIIGSLAIYAPTLSLAWQVRELVAAREQHDAFGTVLLPTGQRVDWIDMSYQAMQRRHAHDGDDALPVHHLHST